MKVQIRTFLVMTFAFTIIIRYPSLCSQTDGCVHE